MDHFRPGYLVNPLSQVIHSEPDSIGRAASQASATLLPEAPVARTSPRKIVHWREPGAIRTQFSEAVSDSTKEIAASGVAGVRNSDG